MSIKYLDIEYLRTQRASVGQLLLAGQSNTVTYTDFVTVDINGNVGIGTASAANKLAVAGDTAIFGTLQASTIIGSGLSGSLQFAGVNSALSSDYLHLYWDSTNARLGIGTNSPVSTLQINYTALESTSTFWSSTAPTVLDSFACVKVRSAHYFVQVTDEDYSQYHTSQIMVVQDGINAYKSEYNTIVSHDKLGSFDCQVNAGQLQLIFTAFTATNKTVKITRTSMTA